MQENLRVKRFNDGTAIPTTADPINNDTSAIYYWHYDMDSSNTPDYGLLYTWNVVRVNKRICPQGWHVPSNAEWDSLISFLGGDAVAAGKLKDTGTTYWTITDSLVDNSSGFNGRGAGFRGNPSGFRQLMETAAFWSTDNTGSVGTFPRGYAYRLFAASNMVSIGVAVGNNGNSIRCIKDEVTGIDEELNEFKIYPNPARGQITIEPAGNEKFGVSVYDLLGKEILNLPGSLETIFIETNYLETGFYILRIESGNSIYERQIQVWNR